MQITRLPEIAEIIMGQSPPGNTYNEVGDGLPFFQGKAEFGETSPTVKKWCNAPKKIAEPGDILMSVRAPVGPTNLASERCCIGRGLAAIRANSVVLDPGFLRFFLRHEEPRLAGMGQGSTFAAIGRAEIARLELRLPSLAEQRRIVDILSRAEGIVRLRREARKKAAEIIPALFLDMFGDPATNPKGWDVVRLGAHVEIPSVVRTPDLVKEGDALCIGADSIESKTSKLITRPLVRDVVPKSGKYQFMAGDVLYSKIRPYLAKAALADCNGFCSADMYPLRCGSGVNPEFLLWLLLSREFTEYAIAESVRAQMPKLNREALFNYQFPLPRVAVQKEFGKRGADIRSLQCQQREATAKAEATFDALLGRAFQGNL
jgi:type I restriction enzyme S subunit